MTDDEILNRIRIAALEAGHGVMAIACFVRSLRLDIVRQGRWGGLAWHDPADDETSLKILTAGVAGEWLLNTTDVSASACARFKRLAATKPTATMTRRDMDPDVLHAARMIETAVYVAPEETLNDFDVQNNWTKR